MNYRPDSTDEDLVAGCCEGHRLAQRYLYERYAGKLLGIPLRYTRDREDAMALFNQAFLKILSNLPGYQPTGPLGGWMARIVFNTCIDHVRSQKTYKQTIHFPETMTVEGISRNEATDQLDAESITRLIQSLPDTARNVFSLYVIDGYRHKDIGEMLGIDEGTSRWHLAQARKTLQKKIHEMEHSRTVNS
ncbi:MAG: RNA polymerase sigma factor [Saprospiraceae bacterium]